eukprot:gnl/TRDRNA2_/TRDRNA2_94981_c0_seq3.p1 gnl/TRDRNA2_/TRDRNA2_94981_c0~~gnl/TRDRNA2_/TRDRNA2_94981_c0_seq3.p1  ORF type:complete len:334 (+),score=52.10 gnl/TRDRNA2_/TRDRNA2_94981_c0_seq3:70-1071(+)
MPIRYRLADGHDRWPGETKRLIVASMDSATDHYNAVSGGTLDKDLNIHYCPEVPTADGNINGNIRFGKACSHRVALHEIAHTLGVGQHRAWRSLASGGRWTGSCAIAKLRELDGPNAILNADVMHFWPYGLNYDNEWSEENGQRHVQMVAALLADLEKYPFELETSLEQQEYTLRCSWPGSEAPVPIHRFCKFDMAYYCHSGWAGYPSMAGWGWGGGKIAFFAWPPESSAETGTVEIHVFRKGEMAFLCHEEWQCYGQMKGWGWDREKLHPVAFRAFPPPSAGCNSAFPGPVLNILEFRKGELAEYIPEDSDLCAKMSESGWSKTRIAFVVPA